MASDPVKIEGLRDFQASLRRMDRGLPKQLRLIFNDAVEIIVEGAQPLVPSRSGRARASMKGRSSQREGRVQFGSARAPYAPWLDFGGSVGRRNSVKRPFLKEGRYLYPTYSRRRPEVVKRMERGLSALIRSAGLAED